MEIDLKRIDEALSCEENIITKTMLCRLSLKLINREYKKDIFSEKLLNRQIYKMREKYFYIVKDKFFDNETAEIINNHYLILKELKKKININDEDQIFKIKYEVTILECLLDMEISYIDTAIYVLDELININKLKRE